MFSPNPLVKKAVASLWDASCRVYVYRKKRIRRRTFPSWKKRWQEGRFPV